MVVEKKFILFIIDDKPTPFRTSVCYSQQKKAYRKPQKYLALNLINLSLHLNIIPIKQPNNSLN